MTFETTTANLVERIKAGESMLNEGATFHAVLHFAALIAEHPEDADICKHASRALVASIENDSIASAWNDDDRHAFYRSLVLQAHCPRQPPFLHEAIVNRQPSQSPALVSKLALAFTPTLRALRAEGETPKNFVMMVLILRKALRIGIDQAGISAYHLACLPKFSVDDMSLLYNSMFSTRPHDSTAQDIVKLFSETNGSAARIETLPIFQYALFEWLLGAGKVIPKEVMVSKAWQALAVESATPGISAPDIVAAAKSLLTRYQDVADIAAAQDVADAPLRQLMAQCTAARAQLQSGQGRQDAGFSAQVLGHPAWQAYQAAKGIVSARVAPFVRRSRRRLKVAVCVSGQLRGYKAAFATWQRSLLPEVDHALFVHSWTRIGRSGAEPFRYVLPFASPQFSGCYKDMANRVGFEDFQQRYPAFFRGLAETGLVTASEVADFYDTEHVVLDEESSAPFGTMSNQDKMHYKIQASFDLACRSGGDHDLIIRIRPDKPVKLRAFDWAMLRDICRGSSTIYADHATGLHYSMLMIGDQLAIGTPATMSIYSHAWDLYPPIAAAGLLKCAQNFEGHATLAQVCWLHGIDVKRIPMTFGKLQDAESLGSRQILAYLTTDAAGRMDEIDQTLIRAASADLEAAH